MAISMGSGWARWVLVYVESANTKLIVHSHPFIFNYWTNEKYWVLNSRTVPNAVYILERDYRLDLN